MRNTSLRLNTYYPVEPESETLPQVLYILKDEERWAFLLRYYDYFGFPVEAIQGLARKRGMTIKDLTVEIVHAFHGEKEHFHRNV